MSNTGGAWDNAKKYCEKGELNGCATLYIYVHSYLLCLCLCLYLLSAGV